MAKAKAKVKVTDLKSDKKGVEEKLKNVRGGAAYTSLLKTTRPSVPRASEGPCYESTFCY
jgi:hypothetical protein